MSLSIKHAPLSDNPESLNLMPYMCLADANLRVISIFDDLKYDRAGIRLHLGLLGVALGESYCQP